ncbi:MAG: Tol-Pal system beta propeller repeat protein TolB [Alphaproteobacteria bacterium]|nr:Tol-Pal system beta propeller repeat protein TolB [Alphaproteobacteria bacterium]MDA7982850.1 Tol-Pal system beta propeller repeat protein TolB [Alphaproteobacteria bacterium]MDA7988353.1 Tol-Pal system beta propeller repeat protein TolB [Alphaproteobacteria bacterium]MDA8010357.1 Tol-Pal system beta propeller repeat protein TolB [Alphaproteobacteria bacterium]MDA8030592.1 Tol-Pal system beta propeller repeat protein TolB [Alphaproteobacteria bacterium]
MRSTKILAITITAAAITLGANPAHAQLRVDVESGFFSPLPIAIPPFHDPGTLGLGNQIAAVTASDLERSGLFKPASPAAFLQTTESLARGPRFGDWRLIDAQLLLVGSITPASEGRFRAEFRLYDTLSESQMLALAFTSEHSNWRRVSHLIADRIYSRVLGEEGYFDSRIVYVSETGSQANPQKRLAIMDQDGHNHRFLTDGSSLVLTPRFSPDGTQLVYLSFAAETPRVHLYDLRTRRETLLGDFPGMSFAPRFSPDGSMVVMARAEAGNSDIYTMNLRTRSLRRLTTHPAIDTSPHFSPDGTQVVFNSDRGGKQQIYMMDTDGGNIRRVSFGKGRYATPVWSPRGDLLAFTRIYKGVFYVGVMRPDGSGERMLARGFSVEAPSWSPNGRVISYFKEERASNDGQQKSRLYSIDVSGYNERQIPTPLEASDPSWSPLNP